jgi:hypothetical protein
MPHGRRAPIPIQGKEGLAPGQAHLQLVCYRKHPTALQLWAPFLTMTGTCSTHHRVFLCQPAPYPLSLQSGSFGAPEVTRTRGKMGIAPHPGTTRVLDRTTLKMVPCDRTRCPLAEEVVMEVGAGVQCRLLTISNSCTPWYFVIPRQQGSAWESVVDGALCTVRARRRT